MAASLDLHLLPIARTAGHDYPELLCVHAAEPPRRRARGREQDRLVLYLAMFGNALLPPGKQEEALAELARLFYTMPGSVTAALRRTAEELNQLLLERNLRLAGSSRQGLGVLVQAVVRGSQLTLSVSGPAQIYSLTAAGVEEFADPQAAERALGQGKATPLSFFQRSLESGDTLLLAAQPAPDWSVEALAGLHGQGPESLRRRLFRPAVGDLNAVLVQARPGKGVIHVASGRPPAVTPPTSLTPEADPTVSLDTPLLPEALTAPAEPVPASPATERLTVPLDEDAPDAAPPTPATLDAVAVFPEPAPTAAAPADEPAAVLQSAPAAEPAPAAPRRERRPLAIGAAIAAFFAALAAGLAKIGGGLRAVLVRILPEDALASIPSSVMAFTAVATPLVIVAVAGLVYNRLGVDAQFEILFSQARQMGARAVEQTDIAARQDDLRAAEDLLAKAEFYAVTSETQALRAELRRQMDDLDLVRRVDYKPAIIGGLPDTVQVARLAVFEDDLYLLDGVSGTVLHARLTGQGYQLDPNFACGANAGIAGLGALVDIAIWPLGYTPEGNLLAMDAAGASVYCRNAGAPEKQTLLRPEAAAAWGELAAFTLDQGDGYVLERQSAGVWIYPRSNFEGAGENASPPQSFFNADVPDVQTVADMAVNRDELYLLHTDGRLTLCYYSDFQGVPTRCSMPAFIDRRPGRENMPLVPPAPFAQILNTAPPDPSLFLLEPSTQAIFHFSLRNLTFQRQYLPTQDLGPVPATAFAVDNLRRYLFLALGNQVYYAVLP